MAVLRSYQNQLERSRTPGAYSIDYFFCGLYAIDMNIWTLANHCSEMRQILGFYVFDIIKILLAIAALILKIALVAEVSLRQLVTHSQSLVYSALVRTMFALMT
ncbi:MAG: hypothetical protein CMIDDMOC_00877 [Sodalis sp. Fle]|nr:MAG: hypothetical protein CMIDDMOC_00877 [Sodalis sp. Fle]